MATPDEVKLQKGTVAPTQAEQTGSAKAVSLIDNFKAINLTVCRRKITLFRMF